MLWRAATAPDVALFQIEVHADVREVANLLGKYDADASGEIELPEFTVLCRDLGESPQVRHACELRG